MYEFRTRCSLADHYLFVLPVTSHYKPSATSENAASCCASVAADAGAFRLRLRVCLATARFAEDILLTIKAGPASNASRRLVGTRMSFREVVDGARVASCLVKVSFREVVDSAPQASFHEGVDGCLR